jgi:lipopolysaccharide export system permease protein
MDELFRYAYGDAATSREQQLGAQANLHFRLVEILMMGMLPLLAIALAVPPKRSSSALGIFIGIVMVVAYHKVNQYGASAGAQGRIDPVLALWVPFALLAALIGWMYHVIAHRPGGQPIGSSRMGSGEGSKGCPLAVPEAEARVINLDSSLRGSSRFTRCGST